ncbi:NTP transferase domain-containing protein [Natronoarchaeum sp. GCM10025703]|uniref:nucleotidyltransferase family protein n=1 Tax=Natronoarchaeum sp. GCM10025703 TaxID=3252685 RepID=UPI00360C294E
MIWEANTVSAVLLPTIRRPFLRPTSCPGRLSRNSQRSGERFWQQSAVRHCEQILAEYCGKPVVEHAVETVVLSLVDGVSVVTGYDSERVKPALDDHATECIENTDNNTGQSTSVRAGVRAVRAHNADAILILLGDMPSVAVRSLDLLIEAYYGGVSNITVAAVDRRCVNPVPLDASLFGELTTMDGNVGGKELFQRIIQ